MSDSNDSDGRTGTLAEGQSVLANLPRTRPQRSSARRAAARGSTAAGSTAAGSTAAGAKAAGASEAAESAAPARRSNTRPKPKKATRTAGARTTAAHGRAGKAKTASSPAAKRRKPTAAKPPAASAKASRSVPRQGYEAEADRARGPVQPPGGTELVSSAVEIVGELAKSGLARSERLLKDVFSRLTPS
jgi:hypothetical protein